MTESKTDDTPTSFGPIRYRTGSALDPDLSPEEEFVVLKSVAQNIMTQMSAVEMIDTLAVYMNVCETRAMLYANHPEIAQWYQTLRGCLYVALVVMTKPPQVILPNEKLCDPSLYWPESIQH